MNTIFSIRKPYTDYIFDGIKNLEFRKKVGKNMKAGDTVFLYETKKNHGLGKVVGSAEVKNIIEIPKVKIGTYFLLPYFIEKFGTEAEKAAAAKAMQIQLSNYDPTIVLDYFYDPIALDYMKKYDEVPEPWEHPYTERFSSAEEFNQSKLKADALYWKVDHWAEQIGFYDEMGESNWNYAIELQNIKKYQNPREIQEFKTMAGEALNGPPQSWCYVLN